MYFLTVVIFASVLLYSLIVIVVCHVFFVRFLRLDGLSLDPRPARIRPFWHPNRGQAGQTGHVPDLPGQPSVFQGTVYGNLHTIHGT